MKRFLVCSMVALAVLAACGSTMGQEKGGGRKKMERARARAADANRPAVQDPNAVAGRRLGVMGRAFEARVARLEAIREIAAGEGAKKTVAALDELIAEEKKAMQQRMERLRDRRGAPSAEADREKQKPKGKAEGKRKGGGRRTRPDDEAEG